jgi:hypothetical protein
MPLAPLGRQPLEPVDQRRETALRRNSYDESGRHRWKLNCSPLVARLHLRGAMARLID